MKKNRAVTIGTSCLTVSAQAGAEAAAMALETLGPNRKTGWALAFCGGRHDPESFLAALHQGLGDVPVMGGSAIGCITNTTLGYSGFECAVAVFADSLPRPRILTEVGLDTDERVTGARLGKRLSASRGGGGAALLFYDSIRSAGPPPDLHVGSLLLDGIHEGLGGKSPLLLVGGGTLSSYEFNDSFVFDGRNVRRHAVVAVVLPEEIGMHLAIMHGCVPVSGFYEITRIEGATVYELDGRPALEVLTAGDLSPEALTLSATLGRKHGDPYGPDEEGSFVNRLIMGFDPQAGSVTIFEADFGRGERVQIMSRDNTLMIESARRNTARMLEEVDPQRALFGLYVDCAGRTSHFCGSDIEEASVVQAAFGDKIPLLGFYSGVEIAPVMDKSRPLDWSGVLVLFTRRNCNG